MKNFNIDVLGPTYLPIYDIEFSAEAWYYNFNNNEWVVVNNHNGTFTVPLFNMFKTDNELEQLSSNHYKLNYNFTLDEINYNVIKRDKEIGLLAVKYE